MTCQSSTRLRFSLPAVATNVNFALGRVDLVARVGANLKPIVIMLALSIHPSPVFLQMPIVLGERHRTSSLYGCVKREGTRRWHQCSSSRVWSEPDNSQTPPTSYFMWSAILWLEIYFPKYDGFEWKPHGYKCRTSAIQV